MSIPRRRMLSFTIIPKDDSSGNVSRSKLSRRMLSAVLAAIYAFIASAVLNLFQLAVLILDNIIWIAIILTLAGPMMLSGLYEAVLDWQILKTLMSQSGRQLGERAIIELLVTVVSGNLLHHVDISEYSSKLNPQEELTKKLFDGITPETRSASLLGLLSSQVGFGVTVGAPVLFYLGAFVYTILDLSNKPSDQDAAISLAFGVEWMIIVHVAIIGACLLATNNPSTASVVAGLSPSATSAGLRRLKSANAPASKPKVDLWTRAAHGQFGRLRYLADMFETQFQPVTMWKRGQNKRRWVQMSEAWRVGISNDTRALRKELTVGWLASVVLVLLPTFVLINLPPIAGAVVAWKTPPVGWGCRSLSFVCYAATQFFVVVFFILNQILRSTSINEDSGATTEPVSPRRRLLARIATKAKRPASVVVWVLYCLACICSLFFALGGTLMQVIGVYRNCFCYVNSPKWLSLDEAVVQVATDTREQRLSNHNWIVLGGMATGFMGLCCWWGWWFQKIIRERYKKIVHETFCEREMVDNGLLVHGRTGGGTK